MKSGPQKQPYNSRTPLSSVTHGLKDIRPQAIIMPPSELKMQYQAELEKNLEQFINAWEIQMMGLGYSSGQLALLLPKSFKGFALAS